MTNTEVLKNRTKQFGIQTIQMISSLPSSPAASVIGRQLLRSATSVGANYRAACRAKLRADFISKMGTVEEEVDESLYWLELSTELTLAKHESIDYLPKEGNELLAIIIASINTAKKNRNSIPNPNSAIRN